MKQCRICGSTKAVDLFTKDKTRKSGYASVCIECNRERVRTWKQQNPDKWRKQANNTMKRWQSEEHNRKKHLAHAAVMRAVKAGDLIKPAKCSRCNSSERIHGHHKDYDKQLDVVWLCHRCHREVHSATR